MAMNDKGNSNSKFAGFDPRDNPKSGVPKLADQAPVPPPFGGGSNAEARRAVKIAMGQGK
jgi:hypothetical protein